MLAALGATRAQDPNAEGDVFLDNFASSFTFSQPGALGWTVTMHEVLHALGLKHPFDDGTTGHPTFAQLGISQLEGRDPGPGFSTQSYLAHNPDVRLAIH